MFSALDIGIDLGTTNVLLYIKDRGIVLQAPSVVALDCAGNKILAIGTEAKGMLGRTPGDIIAVKPLRGGVISDYDKTAAMLDYFIQKVAGRSLFFKPRVTICISSGVTGMEKRAVLEAVMQAGASGAYLIDNALAAALGVGIDIFAARGAMVIDIGGGTTDVAVLSLGSVVISNAIRVGGDDFDEAIVRYMKKKHNLLIGEATAEEIKINIATAYDQGRDEYMAVTGRDLVSGLPRNVDVTSAQMTEALAEPVAMIVGCIVEVLEKTQPELAADIFDKGIVLTGGGALLHGLDRLLGDKTGILIHPAQDMLSCVVSGIGKVLASFEKFRDSLVTLQKPGLNK